ncbi:MAG TPA: hypothetical protein VK137_17100, partial [Planctomycetaceae bacterium]|nr:hypothetical protein [Planctomycetaceae bacterium]
LSKTVNQILTIVPIVRTARPPGFGVVNHWDKDFAAPGSVTYVGQGVIVSALRWGSIQRFVGQFGERSSEPATASRCAENASQAWSLGGESLAGAGSLFDAHFLSVL